ncbi:putative G2/mitotic-specific cyclin S13-7 [Cocos nucifera]|uniref:Putative G2/mitotic-specific cyclin S13-7 n=1 Tax=Cocos nucifera TaxID=13894 RepID=A0A8K0IXY2_COCNU|nr:putative G2/mitotic-specific cyclin S13-7 [Cocos nucifera]
MVLIPLPLLCRHPLHPQPNPYRHQQDLTISSPPSARSMSITKPLPGCYWGLDVRFLGLILIQVHQLPRKMGYLVPSNKTFLLVLQLKPNLPFFYDELSIDSTSMDRTEIGETKKKVVGLQQHHTVVDWRKRLMMIWEKEKVSKLVAMVDRRRGSGSYGGGRGDDPIPTVKQKAAAGGDRKNRRARGDIGNLVMVRGVEGKPQPQISHPVTRSSGPHLLANAQLTAVATADKNSNRPNDYMDSQAEINEEKIAILAEWLIEVHHKFGLMPEILYLTFYIIDRYLSMETVRRRELPLVGVTAMLIACKYEDIRALEVSSFACILGSAYSREKILSKEKEIPSKLEWNLAVPTPYMFLVRFLKAAMSDKEMEHTAFFFAELGLMHYSMIMYCPSLIAASAVVHTQEDSLLERNTQVSHRLLRATVAVSIHYLDLRNLQNLLYYPYVVSKVLSLITEPISMVGHRDCAQHLVSFHSKAAETELKVVFSK